MIREAPYSHRAFLKSLAGVDYQHFAKTNDFHKDLYHELVAPGLQTNILTETWQHGHNIGPSCDGDYTVEDISDVNVTLPVQEFPFLNTHDHSKFVVAKSSSQPYMCVGDINRQVGGYCVKNKHRNVFVTFSFRLKRFSTSVSANKRLGRNSFARF